MHLFQAKWDSGLPFLQVCYVADLSMLKKQAKQNSVFVVLYQNHLWTQTSMRAEIGINIYQKSMCLSLEYMDLSSVYFTSLWSVERGLSMLPSAEMTICPSVLGFCYPSLLTSEVTVCSSELKHPIHASFNCNVPHFHQKEPLGSPVWCLIDAPHRHWKKVFGCFLSPVGYSGYLWKLC